MKKHVIAALAFLVAPHVHAQTTQANTAPPQMSHYLEAGSGDASDIAEARLAILREAGRIAGYRGGKAQRAWELTQALQLRETTLNALYDFRTLISREGWLPPVIDEAKDVAHITAEQIRTASHVYQILSPARFVSNPPSWRSWLLAGLNTSSSDGQDPGIRPDNRAERKIWQVAVKKGWQEGREGADHILEANVNRLTRDYYGMTLYSSLLRQGFISRPQVTDEQKTVSGNREQLVTGDRVRRLREQATFTLDKRHYTPVINTEQHHADNQ